MALVGCPDCSKKVSSEASACPFCAKPHPGKPWTVSISNVSYPAATADELEHGLLPVALTVLITCFRPERSIGSASATIRNFAPFSLQLTRTS